MKTSQNGIALIKRFEGCKLSAYPDPKTGGKPWTIGYGHTAGVTQGMRWTQQQADDALESDLCAFEYAVRSYVTVPLKQYQFDALVSFSFNCGTGNLRKSTLLKLINASDFAGAAGQFGRWISAGSPVEKGLRKRRRAESLLFSGADWTDYEPSA